MLVEEENPPGPEPTPSRGTGLSGCRFLRQAEGRGEENDPFFVF